MSRRSRGSGGFTLVELLVVIAVIGILVALLLPAINAAREAAWRTSCINNVKQLGLAVLNFENAHKSFPPGLPNCSNDVDDNQGGAACQGPNWLVQILPYLEETKKYTTAKEAMETTAHFAAEVPSATRVGASPGIGELTPAPFICPSADEGQDFTGYGYSAEDARLAKGNYAACWGAGTYINTDTQLDGAFGAVHLDKKFSTRPTDDAAHGKWKAGSTKGVSLSYFRDGTSKTMIISEVLNVVSSADNRGAWMFGGMGGASYTARHLPNAVENDNIPGCDTSQTDFMKCSTVAAGNETPAFASARSDHSGDGVVVVFGDNHTEFITAAIDLPVWQAIATTIGPANEVEVPAELY